MELSVESYEEVTSTNNLVKEAIGQGGPEGLVVRALRQTAGYGRRGNGWVSPKGGLYCSWLLRPGVSSERLATLPLLAGLAVRNACQLYLDEFGADLKDCRIAVKWPNDVVIIAPHQKGFSKLCGISVEALHGGVCVGIGINVCDPLEKSAFDASTLASVSKTTARTPIALSAFIPKSDSYISSDEALLQDIDRMFATLTQTLPVLYETWKGAGLVFFLDDLNQHNALQGLFVELTNDKGDLLHQGVVEGITAKGFLQLRQDDNTLIEVATGEAHVRNTQVVLP